MMTPRSERGRSLSLARAGIQRVILFAVLWVVIAGPDTYSWWLGSAVVLCASALSLYTLPPGAVRLQMTGVLRFFPIFIAFSLRGGIDVARQAIFAPEVEEAALVAFTTRLPPGPARTFFVGLLGLFPGTLTADLEGDRLQVHVLDSRGAFQAQLRALEASVADLFGVSTTQA